MEALRGHPVSQGAQATLGVPSLHHPSLCLCLPHPPLHFSVSLLFMEVIGVGFTPNPGGSQGKILNDTCMNPAFSSSEVLNRQAFCGDIVQPIAENLEVDLWLGNWRQASAWGLLRMSHLPSLLCGAEGLICSQEEA